MPKAYLLKLVVFNLAAILSLSANAGSDIVFSCSVKGGKKVEITKLDSGYQYSFGIQDKPELVFRNSKAEVINQSPKWNGQGRYLWTGMLMKNKGYSYHITSYMDRATEEHKTGADVSVSSGDKHLSSIACVGTAIVNWDDEFLW